MTRIDYWRDPAAPTATALVVTVSAVVTDWSGRIVLHRRRDTDRWGLPGGQVELGDSVRAAVVRAVREETGLDVRAEYVCGVYADPDHVIGSADGEVRQEFSVCVKCDLVGGTPAASGGSHEVRWVRAEDLGELDLPPWIRIRITDQLAGRRGRLAP